MEKFSWKVVKSAAERGRRWRKPRAQSIEELANQVPGTGVENIGKPDNTPDPEPDNAPDPEPDNTPDSEPDNTPDPEPDNTPDPEPDNASDPEPDKVDTPKGTDSEEISWIDSLTPIQTPDPEQTDPPAQPEPQQTKPLPVPDKPDQSPEDPSKGELDAAEELRRIKEQQALKERLAGLKTVDPEVAEELLDTIVNPVVKTLQERHKQETDQLRKQLEQVRSHSDTVVNKLTAKERNTLMANTNAKIQKAYPKAYDILNSKQFVEFLDASSNPYATEKKSDILKRAYASGDADYVIDTINDFKNSIQKPKPAVSADIKGASGTVKSSSGGKRMTEAEFHEKRAKLRAAPQTKETRKALRVLSEKYTKQLRGNSHA